MCIAPTPIIEIKPSYLQQGVIGEPLRLTCLIAISSKGHSSLVYLTWNFTSNDSRVAVIPTTATTDNSIGIIYVTVIQFAYITEGDDNSYTCTSIVENDSAESTYDLGVISKFMHNLLICTDERLQIITVMYTY